MKVVLHTSLLLFINYCIVCPAVAQELVVAYSPSPVSEYDKRFDYGINLLRQVLNKTLDSHGPFKMGPATDMNVGRAI